MEIDIAPDIFLAREFASVYKPETRTWAGTTWTVQQVPSQVNPAAIELGLQLASAALARPLQAALPKLFDTIVYYTFHGRKNSFSQLDR